MSALLSVLNAHGVLYVVTGSSAALLHGVTLQPGDLDVTPALDRANLERLARSLDDLDASLDPDEPFGRWETAEDGEQRWVVFEPTAAHRQARARWRPDPADPDTFDHGLRTRHGSLDIVPQLAGEYAELRARASALVVEGHPVWVESVADQLSTLTVPRREKDAERVKALRALQRSGSTTVNP